MITYDVYETVNSGLPQVTPHSFKSFMNVDCWYNTIENEISVIGMLKKETVVLLLILLLFSIILHF